MNCEERLQAKDAHIALLEREKEVLRQGAVTAKMLISRNMLTAAMEKLTAALEGGKQ